MIRKHLEKHGTDDVIVTKTLIRYWWRKFNKEAFKGELKFPSRIYIKDLGDNLGLCNGKWIWISYDVEDKRQFLEVLFHEMVHQWQFVHHHKDHHGKSFQQWSTVAKRMGLSLTESY